MRILHIGEFNFDYDTGTGVAVRNLSIGLSIQGHTVKIIKGFNSPSQNETEKLSKYGIELDWYRTYKINFLLNTKRVIKDILEWNPDIVHFHSAFLPQHSFIAKQLIKEKIPYIITPHGAFNENLLKRNAFKKSLYINLIEKSFLHSASAFTALTSLELKEIKFLVPNANIEVIPNAILVDKVEQNHTKRIDDKKIKSFFLGRYDVRQKGIDFLVKLIEELNINGIEIDIELHGRSYSKTKKELDIISKKVPENIKIMGPIYGEEKRDLFKKSDIYIQTSRWEGFGISVVEAMAAGLPVIVTDRMGISSEVQKYNTGVVIPFNITEAVNILKEVLVDKNKLLTMGENGRRYVIEHLSIDKVAKKTFELYQKVKKEGSL